MNRAIVFAVRSPLKMVKARQVSVKAYRAFSYMTWAARKLRKARTVGRETGSAVHPCCQTLHRIGWAPTSPRAKRFTSSTASHPHPVGGREHDASKESRRQNDSFLNGYGQVRNSRTS